MVQAGVYDNTLGLAIYRKYTALTYTPGFKNYELWKFAQPFFVNDTYSERANGYALLSNGVMVCSADADLFEQNVKPD